MADCQSKTYGQISSYSTSETRIEAAPLQVQATFDSTRSVSIISSGIVGLRSPWSDTVPNFNAHGGGSANFYDPSGVVQLSRLEGSGPCSTEASFAVSCSEKMPTLRYVSGVATLADFYGIVDPTASFNLSISTINPDQPSSLDVIQPATGSILIPNTQAGASRYQITVPGGTGMTVRNDELGGTVLDASQATAGSRGEVTAISVTSSNGITDITQSKGEVSIDPPTALVQSNRVNLIRAAGANINAIGSECGLNNQGQHTGDKCTIGIVVTTEKHDVWDPVARRPVQLIRPRLIDADYIQASPSLLTSAVNLKSLQSDTNQRFAASCDSLSGTCQYLVDEKQGYDGSLHKAIVPINEVPLSNPELNTILLPFYSTQFLSAGGVAAEGLSVIVRSADGTGNRMTSAGQGTTTKLETTNTVLRN
jgi:hypothetical protein